MPNLQNFWFVTALCLVAAGATYAGAQATPAADKPAPAAEHAKHGDKQCKSCGGCPMHTLSDLADAKVESSAKGATVTFTAKKAEDAKKVQELATQLATRAGAECCKGGEGKAHECKKHSGSCEKCAHHGDKHGGDHGHKHD
jgi:hypothetical protein